jgi:hypothetical protein
MLPASVGCGLSGCKQDRGMKAREIKKPFYLLNDAFGSVD